MKILKYICLSLLVVLVLGSCTSAEVRAVRKGDVEEIRKFLADGGDPDTAYDDGNALIHIAVLSGQTASLDTLLQAGAEVNLKNGVGNTAAILAAGANRRDMIDLLITYGGDMRIRGHKGVTTLMLASSRGNVSLMDILLKLGVPVNGTDDTGRSALFYSVSAPDTEALAFLLNAGADATVSDKDNGTPLHLLHKNNHSAYAVLLLERGAELLKVQNSTGESALHIASGAAARELVQMYLARGAVEGINTSSSIWGASLFYAMKENLPPVDSLKTMEILLQSGADPDQVSVNNKTPIVYAVEKLDLQRVDLLIRFNASLDVELPKEMTLLHSAVLRRSPDLVSLLLASINPDERDLYGKTPLFYAVEQNDLKIAEVLLANGCNPNISSNEGISPLFLSLDSDVETDGFSEMTSLLLRYGATIPRGGNRLSELLLRSTSNGNSRTVDLLLKSGADAGAVNSKRSSALMISSQKKFVDISEMLLLWGARVNALDRNGNTALHLACEAGSVEGVELLLRYKADPDPVNYMNSRPIEQAPPNAQGNRIVEILLAAGAKPLPVHVQEETAADSDTKEETVREEETVRVPVSDKDTVIEDQAEVESEPEDEEKDHEIWKKAKILTPGEREPRNVSRKRATFPGYSFSVPESFPRNMYSKFNNQEVVLYIRNETAVDVEMYIINSDGKTDAISRIAPGEVFEFATFQGNTYPVYGEGGSYCGAVHTTGQGEQYFLVVE